MASHCFTEPRWCNACAEHAEPHETACPCCGGRTMLLDDAMEAAWQRQQEDALSEPPSNVTEVSRAAWDRRERMRRRL